MMKTYKHLYTEICSFEALYRAYRRARKGKRDRAAVAEFELNLEQNLLDLQEALETQTYQPGSYNNFYIFEPKKRLISAAPFRDRVVHHALCRVIEPLWETRFIYHSYACRVGKGTHAALDQAQKWSRKYAYVLHGDIVKYFPTIDHEILFDMIKKRIKDKKALWLIQKILDSGARVGDENPLALLFPEDDLFSLLRPKGLPIGNLTSQFWANVYLHDLDCYVKERLRCKAYLRYMDDFLLYSNTKKELQEWKEDIKKFLGKHLRLVMHEKKSVVLPCSSGLDFCGFVIYPTHRRLRKSSVRRFIKRYKLQRKQYSSRELSLEKISKSVRSWIAHASHGNTWHLRNKIFREYPLTQP